MKIELTVSQLDRINQFVPDDADYAKTVTIRKYGIPRLVKHGDIESYHNLIGLYDGEAFGIDEDCGS